MMEPSNINPDMSKTNKTYQKCGSKSLVEAKNTFFSGNCL
jgi:hypothetical protein